MESGQPNTKHRAGPLNQVSRKKHVLRRRKPLKYRAERVTLRIKLHKTINNLIKKEQNVLKRSNLAQLTKMQPKGVYKGYKVARNVLIGIQY